MTVESPSLNERSGAVLITGGAGYIGSHTAWACLDAGLRVVIVDNLVTGVREAIPPMAVFIQGDICDATLIKQTLEGYDIKSVIHFAGSVVVPESIVEPLKYYRNNTSNTLSLLTSCVESGVENFIFSSTAAVYGMSADVLEEQSPTCPINPYGWSKLMSERMLMDVAASTSMRYTILRYFNVAGADPNGRAGQSTPGATHLIKVACQVGLGRRDVLQVFGLDYDTPDGTCVRDFIHVSDLAEAHVLSLRRLIDGGQSCTLNCGYGCGYSVLDVIAELERQLGFEIAWLAAPRRSGDPARVVAVNNAIKAALPWHPKFFALADIIRTALAWERRVGA